jgi:outer membrane protein TolC
LQNQPGIQQSAIDITIAKKSNLIRLSDWLPHVGVSGTITHYDQLPTTFAINSSNPSGPLIKENTGLVNSFMPMLSVTETILSPDVLYAANSAHLFVQQAKQSNDSTKIGLISNVSKAFYGLLFTMEQVKVLREDTARLAKNLRDTYHQYVGGIVDKTDYKEASITLNNSKSQLKQAIESVTPQYFSLKQLMGFPPEKEFNVLFDTLKMMQEIAFDTTQQLKVEKRIEYQLLQTVKSLQEQNVNYYRYQFLPTLSAFYNYNYEYESNPYSNNLNGPYPFSYIGATISIPIFTGLQRIESVQRAKLQEQQIDLALINLKSIIYTQYTNALANYKSNLYDLKSLSENVAMAKDVYSVISLQYKQGVVAYLNVITAESNLISSEISYLNALFNVLLSKVDLERAMGVSLSKH